MVEYEKIKEALIRIQELCGQIDNEVKGLEADVLCCAIEDDDDRNKVWLLSDKMNAMRSYLVYQSKELNCKRTRLEEEIKYYDHGFRTKSN